MVHLEPSDDELNAWVSETASQALGYAFTLVRNRDVAEDLVQDCYGRLLTKVDVYDLPRDGTKLLYRSITNACINWTQRRPPESSLHQRDSSGDVKEQVIADPQAREPIQYAIRRELQMAVDQAMNELPIEQRAAIELRSLGHSLLEVAEALKTTHGNARVLLHRARTTLANRLRPYLEHVDLK